MRLSGCILVNCSYLNSGLWLSESLTLGRAVLKDQAQQQRGQKTTQKTQEVRCLQVQEDLEKKELQDRVLELSALLVQSQKQNEEKEKTMKTLSDTVELLEASQLEKEYEASLSESVKEETLSLQKLIKELTEMLLEKEREKNALLETLHQSEGELREVCQQLEQLRQELKEQQEHGQAAAEGEQLPWLSERRLLSQQLEHLQQAVARLELEKTELKQLNAELRRTLEEVEHERRRLRRCCRGQSLPRAGRFAPSESDPHKVSASRQEESHPRCRHQVAELQKQVSLLQLQLAQERRHKQHYIECSAKASQELLDLHQELSHSLAAVLREPKAAVLEAESRKLDQSLNLNLALISLDHQSPGRQPLLSTARSARSHDLSSKTEEDFKG